MIRWFLSHFKEPCLDPDIEAFNQALIRSVDLQHYDGQQVAVDFRRVFMRDAAAGKRVLFMIMKWCGEYDDNIPENNEGLNRWAGKREIAWKIKAALNADIDQPSQPEKEISNG